MYGMDSSSSPPASHQSSDYHESSNDASSGDGFLSWERSRQSSSYRGSRGDHFNDEHNIVARHRAAVVEDDANEFDNDGAQMYQQQQQHQQHHGMEQLQQLEQFVSESVHRDGRTQQQQQQSYHHQQELQQQRLNQLQQQQQQHQIRNHSLPPERSASANSQPSYQKSSSDKSEDSDERDKHGPTPFRPMAPREFALGNTLRRSRPAMPMATLPADATVARKGSHEGGSSSHQSVTGRSAASLASVSPSYSHSQGEIEMLQEMLQQQQMQKGLPQLPFQEQQQQQKEQPQPQSLHYQQYSRCSTNDSMQRISEHSRSSGSAATKEDSSGGSANDDEPSEQFAGQHAGGEGFQQAAGEAAGECPSEQASDRASSDRINVQNDAAAEALAAAVVAKSSSEKERNQSFGYLAEMSANELLVYEGDPMESWRQSHNGDNIDGDNNEDERMEAIRDIVKEGKSSQEESIQIHSESSSSNSAHSSHSSMSSATGGYEENANDDENDVEDISYDIGTEMGLHSRHSVEQSDISDTASEQESSKNSSSRSNYSSVNDEQMMTENTLDGVRQQQNIDTRNEKDGQYIGHYLGSEKEESMQEHIQSHLHAKRPLDMDATNTNNTTDHDMATERDTGDRFPLTSQTIAIADNADTEEASGAITARFGRLLQECRNLTETCGDSSLRDSMTSSYVGSATKTSSNLRSSTNTSESNEREQRLSSSQLKTAAAMAAANSSSLQRRSYSNPVTQKHEIDTSDGKHLQMSQLTVDPALYSSIMSTDYRASVTMKEFRSSTLAGLLDNAELIERQSSEDQSEEESEDSKQSEEVEGYAETFQVPTDRPLGRREPRPVQPMAKSIKSVVSELSLGVDIMYGDTDEDNTYDKSANLMEDLTAPFDPAQFMAELELGEDPSSLGRDRKSSEFASSVGDSHDLNEQHELAPSNKDEVDKKSKIETDEAAAAKESAYASLPHAGADILANKPSKEIVSPARPSSPSYKSRASYISSEFSADEGGLLVGFGQRNVKRSITSKSSVSSSTSSGAFSSGSDESSSDESSSDESSSSGSSGSSSSSSSSDDDSDSSSNSLNKFTRNGLQIHSSRDSVSELSFGGASALMARQANRALQQIPNRPGLKEDEEAKEADKLLSSSTPSTPSTPSGSKNSSNEGTNDSSSRTGKRNSLIGDVDQLEKLDEVSESTASDFLDDVSSVGDNNYAVQKFFSSPTSEHETTSNASERWSSVTSADHTPPSAQRNVPADKMLHDSSSFSSSPALNSNTEQRLSSSSKSSSLPRRSASPPKSPLSQGTGVSGDKSETIQDAKSSSTRSSLPQNIPTIPQGLTSEAEEVLKVSNITKAAVDEAAEKKRGSPVLEKKDSPSSSLASSSSGHNSSSKRISINSGKSQGSASAASSGSYYKGVLARAAAMNQDEDDDDVILLRSYSHNLVNLLEATPSQDDSSQIDDENASLHSDIQKSTRSAELNEEASGEFNSAELDDISSMSSVVSKARTSSKRASFYGSGKLIETKETQEPKIEAAHSQFDKQSMKSSDSYDGDELYEDFPCEQDDDEVIRRNRSNASQVVPDKEETDARRPWKTAAREEVADIPLDQSVLSAQTGSQHSSVVSGQNKPERNEAYDNNLDDDTSDEGSLSELFGSKEALKRMGLYASAVDLGHNPESDEDDLSRASDEDKKVASRRDSPRSSIRSSIVSKKEPLEEEASSLKSDRDIEVGSLRESIRSSIQSIKEQFFGETRSNYSKSVTSGQSIGSVKGMNEKGRQHQTQLASDNSDGSLSLPKSDEVEDNPTKSSARMFADAAREMSARLDHSMSSRSLLAASKTNEETKDEHAIVRESSVSSASEEEEDVQVLGDKVFRKAPKDNVSHSSRSTAQDDKSISIDSLDDFESTIKVFKKKNKSASEYPSNNAQHVDEEIGLPPKSHGEDDNTSKNEAKSKEEERTQDGAKASWWRVKLTKPQVICGSVTIIVLIILCSVIGATVPNMIRNRNVTNPTSQPTSPPSRLITNWVQVGGDLKGETAGDEAGFSISSSENGYTVIVGSRRNGNTSDGTENRGAAQIFRFDALTGFYQPIWIYHGEAKGDQCGFSVAMSQDGRRVAIGCPGSDTYGKNSGKVRLFMEEELSKTWVMVTEFYGEGSGDLFGASVSLSAEGTHLAVGAPYYTRNEVKRSGSAYAYREVNESDWLPSGSPMRGVVEESLFGWSVSLSRGGVFLAVGAPEMTESSGDGGFVKVFSSEADGSDWQPYGEPISNGVPGDRFGFSVSIAGDKTLQRVAIGAPGNIANLEGGGLASVYEHIGNGWSNAGDDLLGESQGENLGYAVSLTPDASRLVVGMPKKLLDGQIVGQVQVFNVGSGTLTPAGGKYGLYGEKFGVSVAISNNGKRFFGGATDANLVRVYEDIPIVNFNN